MKFLLDKSPAALNKRIEDYPELIARQLLTPSGRRKNWGGIFAIDNGAYAGFDSSAFKRLLERETPYKDFCLFATVPDIVCNARRTLEIWQHRHELAPSWPHALVAQNGIEDLEIPWSAMAALFIGGDDKFKISQTVVDIIKAAQIMNVYVHVGRVNGPDRFEYFTDLGVDSCDGSGVCKDNGKKLDRIAAWFYKKEDPTLFAL